MTKFTDIGVEKHGHVGLIEIQRPPLNFFDISLINQIADALEEFDNDIEIRASVLAAQGKAFCAGANFSDPKRQEQEAAEAEAAKKGDPADSLGSINSLYLHAVRIFRAKKPVVAAVQGAAIGGGLGLAVSADFRVTCPEARFCRQFYKARLPSRFWADHDASRTGRQEQRRADLLHQPPRHRRGSHQNGPRQSLRAAGPGPRRSDEARAEIAECSPLGLLSTRATMRAGLADRVLAATNHELAEQSRLRATEDFKEGVKATAERRVANFRGR